MKVKSQSTLETVEEYIERGWSPIPIPLMSKSPVLDGWQNLRITRETINRFFGNGQMNVGVLLGEPSGGLTDIDLDCGEAVKLAPYILPPTRVFGRPNNPLSHYLYYCSDFKGTIPCDSDKGRICEIRGSGQTVFPGSLYSGNKDPKDRGKLIQWANDREIVKIEFDKLKGLVGKLAASSLILRCWSNGSRDEVATALAGTLLRLRWEPKEVDEYVSMIAREARDDELPSRVKADRLAQSLKTGKGKVPGKPKLIELIGEKNVSKIIEWLGIEVEIPSYIPEFNKDHFVSYFGGKVRVFKERHDHILSRFMLEDFSAQDFKILYQNQKVYVLNDKGKLEKTSIGSAWLEHLGRRQYIKGIRCNPKDPGCETPEMINVYNLWKGFSVKPAKGSWRLLQDHITNILCHNDPKLVQYMLNWMARAVQRPEIQGEVAIVLIGGQGSGKGIFARSFGHLFGQHFIHISNSRNFTGQFNRHLWDCIALFVDEALYAGTRSEIGNLKRMITEPTLQIEAKFKDAIIVPNMLHIIVASNEPWVIPADEDERRYFVLNVRNDHVGDRPYFGAIIKEVETCGYGAMLYDLLNRDISNFDVWDIPNTEALQEQKLRSMDDISKWWFERLTIETLPSGWDEHHREIVYSGKWESVEKKILHEDYLESMKQLKVRYPLPYIEFTIEFRGLLPATWPRDYRPREKGERPRNYRLPPLEDCRKFFVEKFKMKDHRWEEKDFVPEEKQIEAKRIEKGPFDD